MKKIGVAVHEYTANTYFETNNIAIYPVLQNNNLKLPRQ